MTDRHRWTRMRDVFQAALQVPADERTSFVQHQCDDDEMRGEVLRLLSLHDESQDFLESPFQSPRPTAPGGSDPLIGHEIDGFRILRRIGAGGMGVVYEAEQQQPLRRAAIKLLRPGFATNESLRRLEYESEILAKLQHPGIAHVYAAGSFDLGDGAQPWFAMELIEGEPLDAFVEQHRLPVRQKLELLLRICDAVQHAHQRGVIHRDLKPSNIIVVQRHREPDESAGRGLPYAPMILDFGVARATGAQQQATMHTVAGELVGTLHYMSPEQLAGDSDAIDARSDVYALGVIGYEMLSGKLPHAAGSSAVADVVRSIEQDEPKRLGLINPACRGDVETIIAKALEKDRQRRYQSAAEFTADIQRYLNDEPVLARPITAMYQFRKFARRNRTLVGGVAATMLALIAGTVLYALEARHAQRQADRFEYEANKATAINNFMTNDFLMKLLAAAHEQRPGERLPVERLVDQAAAQVGAMFADEPLAEAAVRNEVATVYYNIGAFEKSGEQFAFALDLWESQLGPEHPDTLKAVNNLGQTFSRRGIDDKAEALYRRALEGRLRVLGEDDPYTLASMNNLANLLRWTGRLDEAEPMLRRTLDIQRRVHGDTHKHTLITMGNLGVTLNDLGRPEQALPIHREVYETSRSTLGSDHVMTLNAATHLGNTLRQAGDSSNATSLLVQTVSSLERTVGREHADTILARRTLARVYAAQGRRDDAAAALQAALEAARAHPDHSEDLVLQIESELHAMTAPTESSSPEQ